MKIRISACVLILWFVCWLLPVAGVAIPLSDNGNQHNFSSSASGTNFFGRPHPKADSPLNDGDTNGQGTTEICIFCHTPHSAAPQGSLWNRPAPTVSSFPVYGGDLVIKGSFNVTDATLHSQYNSASFAYPNGASKLCLSCHDGVTAIGTVLDGTAFRMAGPANIQSMHVLDRTRLTVDLQSSHPISFVYDGQVLSDISLVKPLQYQLPTMADVPLDGQQRMQCTTCHDPHEDTRAAIGIPFWRHTRNVVDGEFDDVCNDCHLADKTGPPMPVLHNM